MSRMALKNNLGFSPSFKTIGLTFASFFEWLILRPNPSESSASRHHPLPSIVLKKKVKFPCFVTRSTSGGHFPFIRCLGTSISFPLYSHTMSPLSIGWTANVPSPISLPADLICSTSFSFWIDGYFPHNLCFFNRALEKMSIIELLEKIWWKFWSKCSNAIWTHHITCVDFADILLSLLVFDSMVFRFFRNCCSSTTQHHCLQEVLKIAVWIWPWNEDTWIMKTLNTCQMFSNQTRMTLPVFRNVCELFSNRWNDSFLRFLPRVHKIVDCQRKANWQIGIELTFPETRAFIAFQGVLFDYFQEHNNLCQTVLVFRISRGHFSKLLASSAVGLLHKFITVVIQPKITKIWMGIRLTFPEI